MDKSDITKLIIAAVVGAVVKEVFGYALKASPSFAKWLWPKMKGAFLIVVLLFWIMMCVITWILIGKSFVFLLYDPEPATKGFVVQVVSIAVIGVYFLRALTPFADRYRRYFIRPDLIKEETDNAKVTE
jgi:hypothetical protein